ncbi:MAG TPA: hypothetical protein VEX68_21250 [Bryobacteraceae bacterium]|nr:hypothetical protein [Bryobacteraceae bacterium]
MRTDKQNEASKTNGAKSKGPATPEGKAKSSRNRMRHNLTSGHIVLLSNEDPKVFIQHSYGYLDRFAPADYVERDLVNQMIAASWRLARISAIECSLTEIEMDLQTEIHEKVFEYLDAHARQTVSLFANPDKEATCRMLQRYQAAASRAYARAFRMLKELQGDRFGRLPLAPPVSPAQRTNEVAEQPEEQKHETSVQTDLEPGVRNPPQETNYAPKVIVFKRHTPENRKLQYEPEPQISNPYRSDIFPEQAMCA